MSPDGDLSPSGTTGVTRTVESPSLHWVQRTIKLTSLTVVPTFWVARVWSDSSSSKFSFSFRKAGGQSTWEDCSLGHKNIPSLSRFPRRWPPRCFLPHAIVLPGHGGYHGVSCICAHTYIQIHMILYFRSGQIQKTKKQAEKIQEQMVNEKKRERIELVTALWFTKSVSLQMSWN